MFKQQPRMPIAAIALELRAQNISMESNRLFKERTDLQQKEDLRSRMKVREGKALIEEASRVFHRTYVDPRPGPCMEHWTEEEISVSRVSIILAAKELGEHATVYTLCEFVRRVNGLEPKKLKFNSFEMVGDREYVPMEVLPVDQNPVLVGHLIENRKGTYAVEGDHFNRMLLIAAHGKPRK